jgi:hypothetical protein
MGTMEEQLGHVTVGDNELTDTSIFRETRIQKSEHQKTIATPPTA